MNYLLAMPRKLSTGANTTSIIFPLGIAYVSAAMKQAGLSVYTANLDFPERDTCSILRESILENHIDVLCTGGLSLDCHKIKDLLDTARKIHPKIVTVVGGGIVSSDPETAMSVLEADIGVIGEGERTMCELAEALDSGKRFDEIPGLIFRNSAGEWVQTARRKEIADLDSIPFPDFDGFSYGQWVEYFGGAGVLLSDRSCPFRCTFCFHPTGERYRQRSLDSIFEEIDYQVRRFRIRNIGLSSELFATTRERILEFCARIAKYNLTWSCCLRVCDVNADLLHKMKEAGCYLICYGLESADNSVLKSMRKGITVDQIRRALDLTCEVGISTAASNFIFGDIAETSESVVNTMKFWFEYNWKTHINLSLIQIYPGTFLYEYACENGIIADREQFLRDGCPIVNVSRLSADEFHELTSKIAEYRMVPHVPAESVRIVEIREDERCRVEYVCRKCGTVNPAESFFWFTSTCHCTSCGVKNEVDPFRRANCRAERFFAGLPVDGPIAVWGAGGIYYKLVHRFEDLTSDRFILVDANPEQHGLNICGKTVHAPEVIDRRGVRSVVITALSRKNEIHETLRNRYPSVEDVWFPALDVAGDEIVPILRPFQPIGDQGKAI